MSLDERWLEECVSSCKIKSTAIDVGSHSGNWTRFLAQSFGRVFAIEPDKRASALIGDVPNVTLIEAAAADVDGTGTLYLRPGAAQNSLLEHHPIGADGGAPAPSIGEQEVRLITLDRHFPRGADLVKIDVEGAEQRVLAGCKSLKSWARTKFIVECHGQAAADAVADELRRLGKKPTPVPHPYVDPSVGHYWLVTE